MFVVNNDDNVVRLAVTITGGTVAATADSNAVAAARACPAANSACPAAALNHPTYGIAAAAIDTDAGPIHCPLANPAITDANDDADACKSDANPSQAIAAINNGPDPAPAKIRAELISGGNHEKSRAITTSIQLIAPTSPIPHTRKSPTPTAGS